MSQNYKFQNRLRCSNFVTTAINFMFFHLFLLHFGQGCPMFMYGGPNFRFSPARFCQIFNRYFTRFFKFWPGIPVHEFESRGRRFLITYFKLIYYFWYINVFNFSQIWKFYKLLMKIFDENFDEIEYFNSHRNT